MFGKLLDKVKKAIDETEQIDDRFYALVMDELAEGFKDKAAVGKAIAQADGNESKFDSIYVKIRAQALQEDYWIQQRQLQEQQKIREEAIERKQSVDEQQRFNINERLEEGYFANLFAEEIKNKGYKKSNWGDKNKFRKNGKVYHGKIVYSKMLYVLADNNNEYEDSFSFQLK